MKKIVHLIYRFDIGGLEKVMADTISHSPQFKHIVICLTYATDESRSLITDQIEVIELHKKEGNDFGCWKKLHALFKSIKPDILHSYNLPTLEYQVMAAFCRIPKRIHAEHGRDISDPIGKSTKYKILRKIVDKFIHYWIPVSLDLSRWLKDEVGINPRKIKLIHNGVDCDFFKPLANKSNGQRLENFANTNDIVIGTVGRLDPVKNQVMLIEVFKRLTKDKTAFSKRLKLAIIGDGPLYKELQALISSKQLEEYIWLPGARYNINELINDFDIFVLPSIAEGIPMTILEAMAIAKPVIASNVGGIPEIISKETGILVKPSNIDDIVNVLNKLLSDDDLRHDIGNNARQHIERNFSLSSMINHYNNIYQG